MKHPQNFEFRIYGDLIRGLVYPDGSIVAYRIWNASLSGRQRYTIPDPKKVNELNIPDSVKLAVRKAVNTENQLEVNAS